METSAIGEGTRLGGRIVQVTERRLGSHLESAAVSADTTLELADLSDFDDEGGTLEVDGVGTKTYTALDDELFEITLGTTLGADTAADVEVWVYPAAIERRAEILLDETDDETIEARIPHALHALIPTGIRDLLTDQDGEAVLLDYDGYSFTVTDVLGKEPVIPLALIDPPIEEPEPPTDGIAPATSPTPEVEGGVGFLAVRWTPISNPDPVDYEVHVSASSGFTADEDTLAGITSGNLLFVRSLTDGTLLQLGTDYYVKIIASDADGSAAASAEDGGQLVQITGPDIAVESIIASHILGGQITADKLAAVLVLAGRIATGEEGTQRVEVDTDGIRLIADDESVLVDLPTDELRSATFSGNVQAANLLMQAATLRGQMGVALGGSVRLASTLPDPGQAPIVVQSVEAIAAIAADTELPESRRGLWHDGTNFGFLRGDAYVRMSAAGAQVSSTTLAGVDGTNVSSMVKLGSYWYGIGLGVHEPGEAGWAVWNNSAGVPGTFVTSGDFVEWRGRYTPMISTDGTDLFVAQSNQVPGGGGDDRFRFTRYTNPTGAVPSILEATIFSSNTPPSSGHMGGFAVGDIGQPVFIARYAHQTRIRVYQTDGDQQATDEFDSEGAADIGGGIAQIASSASDVYELSSSSYSLWRYPGFWASSEPEDYWIAYTWYDANATGGTHESALSPRSQIAVKRRRRISVTWPTIPDDGGTNDPDSVRLYMATADGGTTFGSYGIQGTFTGTQTYLEDITLTAGSRATAFVAGSGTSGLITSEVGSLQFGGDGVFRFAQFARGSRPSSPSAGVSYFDTSAVAALMYNGRAWDPLSPIALSRMAWTYDDFLAGTSGSIQGLSQSVSGTGAAWSSTAGSTANHPGVWEGDTGSTANGIVMLQSNLSSVIVGSGIWRTGWLVQTPSNLSDGTNRYTIMAGFADSADESSAVHGAFLRYRDNINAGKWQCRTMGAGTATSSDTGVTVAASTWYYLEVEIDDTAAVVRYYVNGTLTNTISSDANIPTSTELMRFVGGIRKNLGATARRIVVDGYYSVNDVSGARY